MCQCDTVTMAARPYGAQRPAHLVEIARQHPNLIISDGIDKRILAAGEEAIIPLVTTVPDDVALEDYMYYRRRMCE